MEKLLPQLRFPGFEGEWEEKKLNKFSIINPKNDSLPESFVYIDLESVTNGLLVKENIINKDVSPSRAQRILAKEDILFQTVRPYQQNNLFFNEDGDYVASTGYAQIRTQNNRQFLFQFLHTEKFVAEVMLRCTGTSYPAINSTALSEIEINFPSLPEQSKIATFLTEVDKKLTALKQKKTLLERYKKGVMQQIFSQQLRFKDDNGNDFPDWEEKKLGDFCTFFSGGTPTSTNQKFYNGIIPFIGSGNIYDSEVFNFISEEALKSSSAKIVEKGDLLYALYGANSGEVANSKMNGAINQAILCIRNKECIQYLYYVLLLNKENIVSTYLQGGQGNLSSQIIKKLSYKFPSLLEQTKIANFLSAIDEKINHCHGQIEKMQVWKKGLLQQLFV
ncbi:restriction endonuclease subunit S [Flavobacterium sp. I-SCBP12n]|uniref:Restriction endonuclease subunit S n=1 Tax=Flavobacterium pygoscelis TaxID=2893176 RepID=A0A9X2BP25_9FLAO|nr:restriction endonuclease subunit S [Flavobacterium pygoscelis]MCK8140966.1 restriction endonuclease subunit S [Flavobacterium pygoscelis]